MRKQLLYYAVKYKGNYHKIKRAIEQNERWFVLDYQGSYLTVLDETYPSSLRALVYAPWVLFYEGDLEILDTHIMAIIGSRECSEYGQKCNAFLQMHVAKKYTVISGLAKGIDTFAHREALKRRRKTIAVLGCGLDVVYPKENQKWYDEIKKHGLLISEYPNQSKPLAYHFPWRNRIISALCDKLVVIEAKKHSGTMITVNEALQLGKEIYCFPHPIDSENGEGCHLLLEQGCNLLYSLESIKEL